MHWDQLFSHKLYKMTACHSKKVLIIFKSYKCHSFEKEKTTKLNPQIYTYILTISEKAITAVNFVKKAFIF